MSYFWDMLRMPQSVLDGKPIDTLLIPAEVAREMTRMEYIYNSIIERNAKKLDRIEADLLPVLKKHSITFYYADWDYQYGIRDLEDGEEAGVNITYSSQDDWKLDVIRQVFYALADWQKWYAKKDKRPSKFDRAQKELTKALAEWKQAERDDG